MGRNKCFGPDSDEKLMNKGSIKTLPPSQRNRVSPGSSIILSLVHFLASQMDCVGFRRGHVPSETPRLDVGGRFLSFSTHSVPKRLA